MCEHLGLRKSAYSPSTIAVLVISKAALILEVVISINLR